MRIRSRRRLDAFNHSNTQHIAHQSTIASRSARLQRLTDSVGVGIDRRLLTECRRKRGRDRLPKAGAGIINVSN